MKLRTYVVLSFCGGDKGIPARQILSLRKFDHGALPESIFEVIKSYSQVIDCSQFDEEKIFFRMNGTL
jgi:hypothetical protein